VPGALRNLRGAESGVLETHASQHNLASNEFQALPGSLSMVPRSRTSESDGTTDYHNRDPHSQNVRAGRIELP
jgi:hypothetical protein